MSIGPDAPPDEGSRITPDLSTYPETGMTVAPGAPGPDDLWLLADYDPMYYLALMAKYGYVRCAWKAIAQPPPPIKPYIPPRPIPVYIGLDTYAGTFAGQTAPEFTV